MTEPSEGARRAAEKIVEYVNFNNATMPPEQVQIAYWAKLIDRETRSAEMRKALEVISERDPCTSLDEGHYTMKKIRFPALLVLALPLWGIEYRHWSICLPITILLMFAEWFAGDITRMKARLSDTDGRWAE